MCEYKINFKAEEYWVATSLHELAERVENDDILDVLDKENVADIVVRGDHYECTITKQKRSSQ